VEPPLLVAPPDEVVPPALVAPPVDVVEPPLLVVPPDEVVPPALELPPELEPPLPCGSWLVWLVQPMCIAARMTAT
jgi:hypothetical protein